jgi:hypothetical protein
MVAAIALFLVVTAGHAWAQKLRPVLDATKLNAPTELAGPWLVKAGDDPAYAGADFDDSSWRPFDARVLGGGIPAGEQPEFVWYRMHVRVLPTQNGMALEEWNLAHAFEIYVNGEKLIASGKMEPFVSYTYGARLVREIPRSEIATGSLVIAVRVRVSQAEWKDGDGGLYYRNLTLGMEPGLSDHVRLENIGLYGLNLVTVLFGVVLGIVAFALFLSQRQRKEYLWIALTSLCALAAQPRFLIALSRNLPVWTDLLDLVVGMAGLFFLILMYLAFLRLKMRRWMKVYLVIDGLLFVITTIGTTFSRMLRGYLLFAQVPLFFFLGVIVLALLLTHWWRGNKEAGILLIAFLMQATANLLGLLLNGLELIPALRQEMMHLNGLFNGQFVGPFRWTLNDVGDLLFDLSLMLIVVLRTTRMTKEQATLENELAAAREVQQVILPEQVEAVAGFTVESAYAPAQQVGGDFFQVLPVKQDGLLLVLGDVAGHGLPAAMLVSVLVGAIRAAADYTDDPAIMLTNLNERLVGRTKGSFSTALAARITAGGVVTVANAGHLSPYLDGKEIELAGALPLGVAGNALYETTTFEMDRGSKLTFYSDGVIEARDAKGVLFGFERAQAISTVGAAEIVEAAKRFGQEDDITVVTIERNGPVAVSA